MLIFCLLVLSILFYNKAQSAVNIYRRNRLQMTYNIHQDIHQNSYYIPIINIIFRSYFVFNQISMIPLVWKYTIESYD